MGILDKLFGKRKIEKERSETRPEVKQVTEHGSDHDEISNRARNQSSAASESSDKKKVNQECWTTHCLSYGDLLCDFCTTLTTFAANNSG